MSRRVLCILVWLGIWVAAVALALGCRPLLPVDETRYLSVAWDMWRRSGFLVPYLNGHPYSDKPPLLFWLMIAGWHFFGTVEWWPRLVAPLAALVSLALTRHLAVVLWPSRPLPRDLAPMLLVGTVFWMLYQTLTMFDMLLAATALLALIGLLRAWRHGGWLGFALAGVAIGLGVLAKGPAILLHVLPAALLAPLWAGRLEEAPATPVGGWGWWYKGIGLAVGIGAAIGLAWAVPAGISGGAAYREAIFWGQSAGRMVQSFAHARPVWWYAAILPGLILPWLLWPRLWWSIGRTSGLFGDGGVRFALIWFAVAFVAFSLISGKQLHYLLPEFPALALLAARLLAGSEGRDDEPGPSRWWLWPPAALPILTGAAVLVFPIVRWLVPLPWWSHDVAWWWGVIALAAGVAVAVFGGGGVRIRTAMLALTALALLATVHLGARDVVDAAYNLKPLAQKLKSYEDQGYALAYLGSYHSEYQFLGHLDKPMVIISNPADEKKFMNDNAEGLIITEHDVVPKGATPVMTRRYRRRTVVVWDLKTVRAEPGIIYHNQ